MAPPRVQVEASAVAPYRYGLESVLSPRNDPRWDISGIDMPTDACASPVDVWPASCSATAPPAQKNVAPPPTYDPVVPFIIYAARSCKGMPPEEVQAAALRRLAMGEGRATEKAFWNGVMGNSPTLRDAANPVILGPQTGIVAAITALEDALSARYDGVGVIHAPRAVAIHAAAAGLIIYDGPVARTPLGTLWAFGVGYDRFKGPAGEADATASNGWLYATGAITRWRSDPIVNPTGYAALNLVNNEVAVFAERSVMLHRDCTTIAIMADLVPVGGTGGGGGF